MAFHRLRHPKALCFTIHNTTLLLLHYNITQHMLTTVLLGRVSHDVT